MTTPDLIRYLAALLASGSLAAWAWNSTDLWRVHDWHERRISLSFGSVLLFLAYGFGAAAGQDQPLHTGTILLTLGLAVLLVCLLWGRKRSVEAQVAARRAVNSKP